MRDIKNIPDRFRVLFSDVSWNKGNESELSSLQRSDMNQLYLEYNKWSVENDIELNKPVIESNVSMGFID
jgi:hypothetical protein